MPNYLKSHRIYKPTKDGNGCASQWQLSLKKSKRQNAEDEWIAFLTMAKQEGQDDKGNDKFLWDTAVNVKLGVPDLGEIIAVLERRQTEAGYKGSLYHQSPNGDNKAVTFKYNQDKGNFYLGVSAQDKDKNLIGRMGHSLTAGEASILLILLKKAVESMYGW